MIIRRKISTHGANSSLAISKTKLEGLEFNEFCDIFYSDNKEMIFVKPHDEKLDHLIGDLTDEDTKVAVKKIQHRKSSIIFKFNSSRSYQVLGDAINYEILIDKERKVIAIRNNQPAETGRAEKIEEYREKQRESAQYKEKRKVWIKNNKDKTRKYARRYAQKNKEKVKKRRKEWYEKNKEVIYEKRRQYMKEWYQKNKDHIKEERKQKREKMKKFSA